MVTFFKNVHCCQDLKFILLCCQASIWKSVKCRKAFLDFSEIRTSSQLESEIWNIKSLYYFKMVRGSLLNMLTL